MGEEKIPTRFTPTALENEIIKGKAGNKTTSKRVGIFLLNQALLPLVSEHGLIMADWTKEEDQVLINSGYEMHRVQKATGKGLVRAWVKSDLVTSDKVLNQSLDHYATVIQIAGYLFERGIHPTIEHLDGPDISFEFKGKKIYIEYEHGEQSPQILQQKKHDISDGRLFFVGHTGNIKYLYQTVGEENAFRRGGSIGRTPL